jgi:hypothetical protein
MNGIETKYMDEGIGESIDQRSGNDGLSASMCFCNPAASTWALKSKCTIQ